MKKYLAMLCATMLCVCCLGLAACGGSASSSAAASSSSESTSTAASGSSESAGSVSSSASDFSKFIGNWMLAAAESEGITMAGDLGAILPDGSNISLTINQDGTGSMALGQESHGITWVAKDAATITVTPDQNETSDEPASGDVTPVDISYKDNALFMTMSDESFSGTIIFTADGTYDAATIIDLAAAASIASEDALVGNWTLCGMSMMGVSMYGDAASLAAMAGDTDVSASFEKGGKAVLMGSDATFAIDADGASVNMDGVQIPVKMLNDDIVIDLTSVIGMDMAMVFSK